MFILGCSIAFYFAKYEGLAIAKALGLGFLGGILCFFVVFTNHFLLLSDEIDEEKQEDQDDA